jgi:hypothetical protein
MVPLPTTPPMPPLSLTVYSIGDQAAMTKPEPQDVTTAALNLTTSYANPAAELRNRLIDTYPTSLALLSQVLQNSRELRAANLEQKQPEIESKIAAMNKQQIASATRITNGIVYFWSGARH